MTDCVYRKRQILDGLSAAKTGIAGNIAIIAMRSLAGGKSEDANPLINLADCEKEISNAHNASIVFGRDRPGSKLSGYGGRGDTHAGSIDIVVGRLAHRAKTVNSEGDQIYVDPNFKVDAARIYLSQKTDVDRNFHLAQGMQPYADYRSAVAIKADGVRIIAREGIKLVTGADKLNSQGCEINNRSYGIDLIANNDDTDMQPLVKGYNMVTCVERIYHHIDKLAGIIDMLLHAQMAFNSAVMSHSHVTAFFGVPTAIAASPALQGITTMIDHFGRVETGLLAHYKNTGAARINACRAGTPTSIVSYYNYTN